MADPFVIALRRPVGPPGQQITELRLREPKAGEVLIASRQAGRGLSLSLLSQVTGASRETVEALPGSVCDRALSYLMAFFERLLTETDPEEPPEDPPEELTVALPETLQIGTTWVSELTLREPTLGELIKADKYEGLQRTVVLVALAAGQPRAVIELVPISAFTKAATFVQGFTEAAPMSGGVLSAT